ncbi:MAG: hypothetical protein ACI9XR_000409 [Flavobacterium sp.]|jgi:hypothetical protein
MIKKKFIFLLNILFIICASAQTKNDSLAVKINLKFDNQPFQLNKSYVSKNDTLKVTKVKFYLSNVEIEYQDNSVFKETNSYHLIDIDKPESLFFKLKKSNSKPIKSIHFSIGVDSLASVSGANGNDLDLQNGMYWAWQSGYINMKIEGTSKSCATRKNAFQFHIGGYLKPHYAMRNINIKYNGNINDKNQMNLGMDLGKLFSEISLKETNTIIIPGKEAMKMVDLSTKLFSVE